jgi:cellulase/cellobiase CelA1
MRQRHPWWFILVLILPLAISGCDTNRPSSTPLLADNGRFMDMWGIYTHCSRSGDLDAMRVDAQRLRLAGNMTDSAGNPISAPESEDPSAMAAACALRAGQIAQERGHRSFAREMFQMIVTNFPQPRYRYYVIQARERLERLDAETSG